MSKYAFESGTKVRQKSTNMVGVITARSDDNNRPPRYMLRFEDGKERWCDETDLATPESPQSATPAKVAESSDGAGSDQ